jgi:hypothetical protein
VRSLSPGPCAQHPPIRLYNLNSKPSGTELDPSPSFVAFRISDTLDLVEAGDRIANMGGVFQRFFSLRGKREH